MDFETRGPKVRFPASKFFSIKKLGQKFQSPTISAYSLSYRITYQICPYHVFCDVNFLLYTTGDMKGGDKSDTQILPCGWVTGNKEFTIGGLSVCHG